MKTNFQNIIHGFFVVLISFLILFSIVKAGSLAPSSSPAATSYTLSDVYTRLTTNATSTEAGHSFSPSVSPTSTFYTLTQIYEAIPTILPETVKLGTSYLGIAGALTPDGGTATSADVFSGKTAHLDNDWTLDAGSLTLACGTSVFDGSSNLVPDSYDGEGSGSNRWCMTNSGNASESDLLFGQIAWVDGSALTGTYNASELSTGTVKKGTSFGVAETGVYSGYPGTGWTGAGLTQSACNTANDWYWFEDSNGDGDFSDPEDGMCAKATPQLNVWSWNGAEQVDSDDDMYDYSWIGDWTCSGSFPDGTVVWGDYPTAAQVGGTNHIALATADCYDGVRDLLPVVDESVNDSRIVYTGTAESGTATTLVDNDASWPSFNAWLGQKVKIFSGTSIGSEALIATSSTTTLEVASWSAGAPAADSQYGIIYIVPWSCYRPNTSNGYSTNGYFCNGPLTPEVLNNWKGTRLPSSSDFYGICSCGGNNVAGDYETSCSSDKTCGDYGNQTGRTDECIDPTNWEWLSEQSYSYHARVAGYFSCSYFDSSSVDGGYRFRAVFRP